MSGIFVAFSAVFLVLTIVNDVNNYRAAVAVGKLGVLNFALGPALVVIGVPIYFFDRRKAAAVAPLGGRRSIQCHPPKTARK